jgi:hypothetical protein
VTSAFFPSVGQWDVPEGLLEDAVKEVAIDGRKGREGTCLWLGTKSEGSAAITTSVHLRGPGIRKSAAQISIEPWLLREVHQAARDRDLILVGQIHSHGRLYGVDLSPTDHSYGVRVPYFLSVVAPDYGQTWPIDWTDCGVHVYRPATGFMRMDDDTIHQSIKVVNATLDVITIGNGN